MEYNKPKTFILTDNCDVLVTSDKSNMRSVSDVYLHINRFYFLPKGSTLTFKGDTVTIDEDSLLIILYSNDIFDKSYIILPGTELTKLADKKLKDIEDYHNKRKTNPERPVEKDSTTC